MKALRPAFTIIEILISVVILSISIVFVLQVHSDNHEHIVYLSEKNKLALEDSLYLTTNILKHHKDNRTAYQVLERHFKVKELESREILKATSRDIFIPEEVRIDPPQEQAGPRAVVNEILLKDKHSSGYYHFSLESF